MSEYDHFEDPRPKRLGLKGILVRTLWMAASLGALVLVVMKAHELGSGDGLDPPVLEAAGDFRTAPTDPGGREYAGRDLSVYDGFDRPADGGDSRLVADVERPTAEDVAAARTRLTGQETLNLIAEAYDLDPEKIRRKIVNIETFETDPGDVDTIAPEIESFRPVALTPAPAGEAAVERVSAGEGVIEEGVVGEGNVGEGVVGAGVAAPAVDIVETDEPVAAVAAPQPDRNGGESLAAVEEDALAVGDVARPAQRPKVEPLPAPSPGQRAGAADAVVSPQVRTAGVAGSRFEAQLAALASPEAVEEAWDRLSRQHPDLLGGHSLRIEPATVDGQRLYRLRVAPFEDRAAAKALCDAFEERQVDCFVAGGG